MSVYNMIPETVDECNTMPCGDCAYYGHEEPCKHQRVLLAYRAMMREIKGVQDE